MKATIIIPARYGSTRFPGKPLAKINGKEMLHRVWLIAKTVKGVDDVYVATDDERIFQQVERFGGKAVMTNPECANGTARTLDALEKLKIKPDVAINLQGDAVLTPPWVISELIEAMSGDKEIKIATPAIKLNKGQQVGGTMVVFDQNKNALYFSKAVIPFKRETSTEKDPSLHRHIGIYAYRYETLKKMVSLKPTPLEETEKLEQLRALENGIPIKVVLVDYKGRTHWSVDKPEDVKIVEDIIKKEGELV